MQFRRGSGLFCLLWAAQFYTVTSSVRSAGFAKKTFISYSKSFKNSFRQGVVVEIDLKNQTVLLEDGEVSRADGCWWGTWQVCLAGLTGERGLWPPALPGAESASS